MNLLTSTVARWMYAVPMAIFGLFHFISASDMASMVLEGWPMAQVLVYLTGAALIAAAVSIIIRKYDRLAMLLLAGMLIIFVLAVHLPNLIGGDQSAMAMILKDIGLAAGALMLAGQASPMES